MALNSERALYRQIAETIEDGILSGAFEEEGPVPSTNQFARLYQINPATAAKGVNQLVDEGILYKRRGVGMYVAKGAREALLARRREVFFQTRLRAFLKEAQQLEIPRERLLEAIHAANITEGEGKVDE